MKGRWKLIDSKVNEANIIVWRDDVDDKNNDEDGVPDAINANDKRCRRKKQIGSMQTALHYHFTRQSYVEILPFSVRVLIAMSSMTPSANGRLKNSWMGGKSQEYLVQISSPV